MICDNELDPNKAQACARTFISDHAVATVFDLAVVSEPRRSPPLVTAAGIPQVGVVRSTPSQLASPNCFMLAGGAEYDFGGAVKLAATEGLHKLYYLTVGSISQGSSDLAAVTGAAKSLGVQIVGQGYISFTASDYAPYAATIKAKGADGVH